MLAEPAAALGIPLRLLAEAERRLGGAGDPRPPGRRPHRPRRSTRRDRRGCGGHLRPRARAHRAPRTPWRRTASRCGPGAEALVHAQDKAVMRARLTELGATLPASRRRRARVADVAVVRLPVRAQDDPRRLRRQGRAGSCATPTTCAEPFARGRAERCRAARRGAGAVSSRAGSAGRAPALGRGGRLAARRDGAARRSVRRGDRARARFRCADRWRSRARGHVARGSTSPGCSPSSCSRLTTAACSSTSSRCARTTPATGASTER